MAPQKAANSANRADNVQIIPALSERRLSRNKKREQLEGAVHIRGMHSEISLLRRNGGVLLSPGGVGCVNSDVVICCLVPGFNSAGKQSWGEPTDGPIYPKGNLVRGIYPTTVENVCVCTQVCVFLCVFRPERGFSCHTDKVIQSSISGAGELH